MSAFPIKRPGWFLRFYVRLEDFTNPLDDDAQSEDQPFDPTGQTTDQLATQEQQLNQQTGGAIALGVRSVQTTAQQQTQNKKLRRKSSAKARKSAAGDRSKGDDFSIEFATVPLSLDIEDKGFRFAADLTAEFPFVDLPLDPRIIRECRVEAWIGTIPAADFATRDKWRLSPVPSATTVLRFNGYIDLDEMTHNDQEGTIHIKARSFEAVLIDGKINSMASAYRIKGNQEALTVYVNRILAQYPPTAGRSSSGASPNAGQTHPDYGRGNIDLNNRPIIHNPDGSISTVFSMTFGPEDDGKYVLIPGVRFGLNRKMSPKEAYAWYRQTGQYLGKFNTMAEANTYAGSLHEDQAVLYGKAHQPKGNPPPVSGGGGGGDQFRAYWYGDPAKEPALDRKTLVRSLQTAASRNAAAGSTGDSPPAVHADTGGEQPADGGDSSLGGSPAVTPGAMKEDGISIWDLITQACELCGCIPMYRPTLPNPLVVSTQGRTGSIDPANCLLLVPPQAFLDDIQHGYVIRGGARDGFQRGFTTDDGKLIKSDVRFMVWGHNIKSMKLSRKFHRSRPTAVEVRSYNPDATDNSLRVMSSRFPPVNRKRKGKGTRHTRMTEKGHGKIDVVRTFVLKGTRDQLALDQAAISIYHQLCRPELSIELDTDELSSYFDPQASQQNNTLVSSDNLDPDLFRLCPGTPVHVTVARKQDSGGLVISSLSEFYDCKGLNVETMVRQAASRWGYQASDDQLDLTVQRIQKAYQTAKLPEVFFCRSMHLHFSSETDFYSAKMEVVSYLDAMNDPAQISDEAREMNDQRKRHKLAKSAKQKAADDAKTEALKRDAFIDSLGSAA